MFLSPKDKAGWILVGGRSRRMGTDKALIEIQNQPLAKRVAAEISKICGTVSLVGDPVTGDPQGYGVLGMPVISDQFPGRGPLAGIEAALGATRTEWNLVVACDMPSLDLTVIGELFGAASEERWDGVVPSHGDGRIEPLCAVFHARCHATILAAITAGVRKVTDALDRLSIRYLPVDDSDCFANLNTPDDVARFGKERYGRS